MSDKRLATVEWKLNDLLRANRQARDFAHKPAADDLRASAAFTPWLPPQLTPAVSAVRGAASVEEAAAPPDDAPAAVSEAPLESASESALKAEIESLRLELKETARKRHDEGYQQGKQEALQAMEDQRVIMEGLIGHLMDIRIDMTSYVGYIESLALHLARAALRHAAGQHLDYYQNLVRQGLDLLNVAPEQEVRLYLHPDAIALVGAQLGGMGAPLLLLPDARLRLGDLRLACGHTEVEEHLEDKLQAAFEALVHRIDGSA